MQALGEGKATDHVPRHHRLKQPLKRPARRHTPPRKQLRVCLQRRPYKLAGLREALELEGSIFHMTSDTEVIAYTVIKELISSGTVEEALSRAMHKLKGAYSLVILTPSKLLAARDENGFRPLCYGRAPDGGYVAVSESCALDAVGATFVRDLLPGEILVLTKTA